MDVMRERLNYLATIDSNDLPSAVEFSRWADTRLDRWLVDWCLRTGKEGTARLIAQDKGIEVSNSFGLENILSSHGDRQTLVDIELFSELRRIEAALSEHSCSEALTWCSENKAALRKVKVRRPSCP